MVDHVTNRIKTSRTAESPPCLGRELIISPDFRARANYIARLSGES
jgi:hypothetical protein